MSDEPELDFGFLTQNQKLKPVFHLTASTTGLAGELDEQVEFLHNQGVTYLDLANAGSKAVMELTTEDLKRLEKLLQPYNMGVSRITTNIGRISITDSFEPEKLSFERALELADWTGSSYVKIGSFYLPDEENAHEKYRAVVMRRLIELVELSQPWGIIILHENEPGTYGDTAEHCADIINEIGSGNLRTAFNPAFALKVGDKPYTEAYPQLLSQYTYISVDQALVQSEAAMEESELVPLLKGMWENSYQGYVSLYPSLGEAPVSLDKFGESLAKLTQLFELAK